MKRLKGNVKTVNYERLDAMDCELLLKILKKEKKKEEKKGFSIWGYLADKLDVKITILEKLVEQKNKEEMIKATKFMS